MFFGRSGEIDEVFWQFNVFSPPFSVINFIYFIFGCLMSLIYYLQDVGVAIFIHLEGIRKNYCTERGGFATGNNEL